MPFAPLTFFSALLHLYIAWRLIPDLGAPRAAWLLGVSLVVSAALMPLGFLARRIRRKAWSDALAWAGLIFMGLFSSLFVLTVLRDAGLLLGALGVAIFGGTLDEAAQWSARGVPVLAALVTLRGFINARRRAAIVSVDVPIHGLPPALQGFTIAQISDIHVGPTIKGPYLQAIVDAVNGMHADMVAVTGDLVDGSVRELSSHVAPLASLHSRHGTFFVTGNHEYYSGAHAWITELRRMGIRVLMNEHTVL
ncbi:MAG: metallophosphoesterase, partial [Rhizobacter sp.]